VTPSLCPWRRVAAILIVAAAIVCSVVTPGWAAPSEEALTWSVTPADESGPDDRTVVERELDPGQTVHDHFAVTNLSDRDATFDLSAADGYYTRKGRFDMLPATEESVGAGTWIDLQPEVAVPAGETVVVPYTLTVPENAEPGDHAAGIAASVTSVQSDADGGAAVGVQSRVGFQVMTRVTGQLAPAASLSGVSTVYHTEWNPLRAGTATVDFEVTNEGNTRIIAEGEVTLGGHTAAFPEPGEPTQALLPGESRELSVTVGGVWPLVRASGQVTLTPRATPLDGGAAPVPSSTAELAVWALPWPQLLVLGGLALIVTALAWNRLRSRRRLSAMLDRAREEGRREVARGAQPWAYDS